MNKAIIFDFDGVIADSFEANYQGFVKLFSKREIESFDRGFLKSRFGIGPKGVLEDYFRIINRDHSSEQISEFVDEKTEYAIGFVDKVVFNDNFLDFFDIIKNKYKLAIATNNKKEFIIKFLEKNNIENFFTVIIDRDDVEKIKPNPEIFLKASSLLNVKPTDCIVFEDSVVGVITAKNADMKCVAITTTSPRDLLEKENPDLIIDDYTEIDIEDLLKIN